ncbi:MAG: hypothetical protein LAO31_05530 [Acidobacteriia bacterium]|nr:hypothetical protein [Terriglobia bacterium]
MNGAELILKMDSEVKEVLDFMQSNIQACRLVSVANSIKDIAPILWGHYEPKEEIALVLEMPPILPDVPQSVATESCLD